MSSLEDTLRFFANARFLRMLDTDGRKRLLDSAEAKNYEDGGVVVREGEPGDALYIIISGIAAISADDMGEQKAVAELTDGAFFGEMAVITTQPRSATVTAHGALACLRIPKQAVLAILDDYPKVKEVVAKIGLARTEDTMEKLMD
ncbi:MAG: cyclic nucleotide-binding domain-containing protein [Deltaproteobacteria bacterium]|nr:cyclic nucleotide-binding domain-containing protein [Deltaproteobacteria bacterium]